MLLPCQWSERTELVCDLIRAKVPGDGRVIVFCDTKRDCGELQEALQKELDKGAKALHGDVNQSQREVVLAGFRANKFQTLVATDVAARGLDISGVELVARAAEGARDVHPSPGAPAEAGPLASATSARRERVGDSQHRAQGRVRSRRSPAPARRDGGGGGKDRYRAGSSGAQGASKLFMDAATELLASGAASTTRVRTRPRCSRRRSRSWPVTGSCANVRCSPHSGQTTLMFAAGGNTEIRTLTYIGLPQRMNENDLQVRRLTLC